MNRHVFSIIVDNEAGVLARVVGLFAARGYNIESLSVAAVDAEASRITLVARGTAQVIEQISKQCARLVPVRSVCDLTSAGSIVERELALVRLQASESAVRIEALQLATAFRARTLDAAPGSLAFEITGGSSKIDAFLRVLQPLGVCEVARTGVTALARGGADV